MEYGKLNKASKHYNCHYRTILNWAKSGKIKTITTPGGIKQYELLNNYLTDRNTIGYIRVSSYSQKEHLQSQTTLLQNQFPVDQIITEIGSGLNFKRKKLRSILEQVIEGNIKCIVVTHKDRLCRFGFELIEWFCERFQCKIVVLNQISTSPEQELVQDILAIIHVFSSRLYGLRKYKQQFKNLQDEIR